MSYSEHGYRYSLGENGEIFMKHMLMDGSQHKSAKAAHMLMC